MRELEVGVLALAAVFGLVAGCGDYDSDAPSGAAGGAGRPVAGSAGTAGGGKGGTASAGASNAGAASGGAAAGSNAGGSSGSGGYSGNGGYSGSDGGAPGEAGAPSSGGSGSLFECNPTKVTCKALPPVCPASSQAPSVEGTCWGDCVEITECACLQASDCPKSDEYFCRDERQCSLPPK